MTVIIITHIVAAIGGAWIGWRYCIDYYKAKRRG